MQTSLVWTCVWVCCGCVWVCGVWCVVCVTGLFRQQNVSINAFYVTLTQGARDWPAEAGGALGQSVFDAIVACVKRGVRVRLIVGWPAMDEQGAEDPAALEAVGVEVREKRDEKRDEKREMRRDEREEREERDERDERDEKR